MAASVWNPPQQQPNESAVQFMYRKELLAAGALIASLRYENHALKLANDELRAENARLRLERAGLASSVASLELALAGESEVVR